MAADALDRELLALLRENARMPAAQLARRLGIARATVQNRIARLELAGTITGYTVRVSTPVQDSTIRALMMVAVEGNHMDAVVRMLRGDPAVTAIHSTNGRWDIVAELRAENLEDFDRVLVRVRSIKGVLNTETSLLLSTVRV